MKFWTVPLLCAGLVAAQVLVSDYFPECSLPCLEKAVPESTDCTVEDAACICVQENYEAIVGNAQACVLKDCGNEVTVDQVLPAAQPYCSAASSSASAAGPTATGGNSDKPTETPGAGAAVAPPLFAMLGLGAVALF